MPKRMCASLVGAEAGEVKFSPQFIMYSIQLFTNPNIFSYKDCYYKNTDQNAKYKYHHRSYILKKLLPTTTNSLNMHTLHLIMHATSSSTSIIFSTCKH